MTINTNGFNAGDKAWCVWKKWGDYCVSYETINCITITKSYFDDGANVVDFEIGNSITIPIDNSFNTEQEAVEYCDILNKEWTANKYKH